MQQEAEKSVCENKNKLPVANTEGCEVYIYIVPNTGTARTHLAAVIAKAKHSPPRYD